MTREAESLRFAAQNQSIRTNLEELKTDRSQEDSTCRLCKRADGSTGHVVSGCTMLA